MHFCRSLKKQAQKFIDESHPDIGLLLGKMSELDDACQRMEALSKSRLSKLQESLKVQEFFLHVEEEEAWIREKEPLASSADFGKDIGSVVKLKQKHQTLEAELQGEDDNNHCSINYIIKQLVFQGSAFTPSINMVFTVMFQSQHVHIECPVPNVVV